MKNNAIAAVLLFGIVALLHATPDRERYIVDTLLGFSGEKVLIVQSVYDNKGSHYDEVYETYLLEKQIEEGRLVLSKQTAIRNDTEITQHISTPEFRYAVPRMLETRYFHIDENNRNALYYFGIYYDLHEVLPHELWDYDIDKVEQLFDFRDRVLMVLDLISKSKAESLRKVVLLK